MAKPKPAESSGPAETPARSPLVLPFLARHEEIRRLCELHARREQVLILGPAGVGKSALVAHLRERLSLLVSARSACLGQICEGLEPEFGFNPAGLKLLERKKRLRQRLAEAGRTVVFDGAGWTTPKLSSFFEGVAERGPVWICARSEHPWDIGHFWPLLVRFERVELRPFHLSETQALVDAAVEAGIIPPGTRNIVEWLHRRSGGSPLVLRELFKELATGRYDLHNPLALRRLDLDRRIHEVFPGSGPGAAEPRGESL